MRARAILLGGLIVWMTLCAAPNPGRAAEPSLEYAVKAAYLPKLVPFISWPQTAFASPTAAVTICVLGGDPFAGKLEQMAGSFKVGERVLAVRHLAAPDDLAACHLLFLAKDDPETAQSALAAVAGKPVVTVTDSGLPVHGIISFVIDGNHVRFDIDDGAAAQSGLVISSKLLDLAHAVKARRQP